MNTPARQRLARQPAGDQQVRLKALGAPVEHHLLRGRNAADASSPVHVCAATLQDEQAAGGRANVLQIAGDEVATAEAVVNYAGTCTWCCGTMNFVGVKQVLFWDALADLNT